MVKRKIKNIIVGASSLLDISGHAHTGEPSFKSVRLKSKNKFYTHPVSDVINTRCDWGIVGSSMSKAVDTKSAKKHG